jgi:ornithine cyclodeaminase
MKEVDDVLVQRCEVIIDTPEALDVGDLSWLKLSSNNVPNNTGMIGDALVGNFEFGKLRDDPNTQINCTFFKSCGTAIQDVVSAQFVFNNATMKGIGKDIEM